MKCKAQKRNRLLMLSNLFLFCNAVIHDFQPQTKVFKIDEL